VAISLHIAEIAKMPHFRVRAFGNTFELVGQLINSALVLAPQPVIWLGIELALLSIFLFFIVQVRFQFTWAKAQARVETLRSLPWGRWLSALCSRRYKPGPKDCRRALPIFPRHTHSHLGGHVERIFNDDCRV